MYTVYNMNDLNLDGRNTSIWGNIQSVNNYYHISFLHTTILILCIVLIIFSFLYKDTLKTKLRYFVRKNMYDSHMNRDKTQLLTSSKVSHMYFYQWLTYLEQTWLSDDVLNSTKLPSNVYLSEKINFAIESFHK